MDKDHRSRVEHTKSERALRRGRFSVMDVEVALSIVKRRATRQDKPFKKNRKSGLEV